MNTCFGASALILAQATQTAKFIICGPGPSVAERLVPLLGLAIFAGACVVVAKSRRPAVIGAYLLFVPMPMIVAVFAVINGMVDSFSVLASSRMELKPSEIAGGNAEALRMIMYGILGTMPAYLVIAVGLFVRTFQAGTTSTAREQRDRFQERDCPAARAPT